MSDNEINDVNCDSDCGSCGDGNDKVDAAGGCGAGGGDGHKQADLKTLIFVLVLILAGAVAAHSLIGRGKDAGACGADGSACDSKQVEGCSSADKADEAGSVGCPVSGEPEASEDSSIKQCSITAGDDVVKDSETEKAKSACCPGHGE